MCTAMRSALHVVPVLALIVGISTGCGGPELKEKPVPKTNTVEQGSCEPLFCPECMHWERCGCVPDCPDEFGQPQCPCV